MSWFLVHIFFSLLWGALLGAYDLLTLISGFALGLVLFRLTLNQPSLHYRRRVYAILNFSIFYLREILFSNLRIALDVIRKRPEIKPGIVALDASKLTSRSKVLVANLITMTPGTLSLDISDDERFIYVHCLYLQDPESARASMQKDYVDKVAALSEAF